MRKIKNYILMFTLMLLSVFVMNSRTVFAEDGTESEPVADPTENYVIFNPNSRGEPTHVYIQSLDEGTSLKQYTKSRDLTIKINIPIDKLSDYEDAYSVCEMITDSNSTTPRCLNYLISEGYAYFQISSMGDGDKNFEITFKGNNGNKDLSLQRKIILDTIGPVIELTGGEYVFIPLGQAYEEKGAKCTDDSGVKNGECTVTWKKTHIDMNSTNYQYIRYTVQDFLGNETNAVRKILVEVKTEEKKDYTYWIVAGVGLALLSAFLFIQVWKNKEKQKNQSVL